MCADLLVCHLLKSVDGLIVYWGGYHLEEEEHVLDHGTSVTELVKVEDQ